METLKMIGEYANPRVNNGKPMPLYEMGGFINTAAGWNLLATGNRETYQTARAMWEEMSEEEKLAFETWISDKLKVVKEDTSHE